MLPIDFQIRMKEMLKSEYNDFMKSYDKPRFYALRVNTLKGSVEDFINNFNYNFTKVPWSNEGFYYNDDIKPGKHPYHEAGVYYIQEPSAMSPASYLQINPGDFVLDLCAAPGGKSTQLAAKLQGDGLLISNEIHPSRAKILSENIERMGIRNAIVTNESSETLAHHFPEYFDKIMVDAPCSGEGMFRKNSAACEEWSLENVEHCAERQMEILNNAASMLKSGGQLAYSTCTFSYNENEGVIENFLKEHTDFRIVNICKTDEMSEGLIPGTIRLWPHKLNGEGHFLTILKKCELATSYNTSSDICDISESKSLSDSKNKKVIKGISLKECKDYLDFCDKYLNINPAQTLIKFGDQLYSLPEYAPSLKGLRVLRAGLHLGTSLKGRFEPSHSLALALKPADVKYTYNFNLNCINDSKTIYNYINGETFETSLEHNGWYLITVDGYSIGFGKYSNGIMKNHYPKGLRKNLLNTKKTDSDIY